MAIYICKIDISCSVGVTFVETPRVIFDEIYHQADSAAYEAKKNGKKSYHILIFIKRIKASTTR